MSCPDSTYNGVDIKYTDDCKAPACSVSSDCTAISPNLFCGSGGTCQALSCTDNSNCPTGKCENGLCVPDDSGLNWVIIFVFIIIAIIGGIIAFFIGKAAYKKYKERKEQQ